MKERCDFLSSQITNVTRRNKITRVSAAYLDALPRTDAALCDLRPQSMTLKAFSFVSSKSLLVFIKQWFRMISLKTATRQSPYKNVSIIIILLGIIMYSSSIFPNNALHCKCLVSCVNVFLYLQVLFKYVLVYKSILKIHLYNSSLQMS